MSEIGGFDLAHYARTTYLHFDTEVQAARYRDTIVKSFMRNYANKVAHPLTGADDQQAHAPVRSTAVAVMYGGSPHFDEVLDNAIRVTQVRLPPSNQLHLDAHTYASKRSEHVCESPPLTTDNRTRTVLWVLPTCTP